MNFKFKVRKSATTEIYQLLLALKFLFSNIEGLNHKLSLRKDKHTEILKIHA